MTTPATSSPAAPADGVPQRTWLWRFFQTFCRIVTTLMFDLKVYGKENVPPAGGVILAANHQSYLDPVLVAVRLRRPVAFLAKSSLFKNRFFGAFIRSLHAFPIEQGKGDRAAINQTIDLLKTGHVLNLYPEGHRTTTGELLPIQSGIALVARRAGVPIVPIAIEGSFYAWPKRLKLPRPHKVRVLYGKPIDVSKLKGEEITALIEKTLRAMIADLRARQD